MKGINSKHKVFIYRCDCGCHYLDIDYYEDDGDGYIKMTIDTPTIIQRIKHIIKYLWKGGAKFEYWGEICFRGKDVEDFINFFKSLKIEGKNEY